MEQWENLIQRAQNGDKTSRDKLVADNLGLVHTIVRRFEHRGKDREEHLSEGKVRKIVRKENNKTAVMKEDSKIIKTPDIPKTECQVF